MITETTPEDERPAMIMRMGKNGNWADMATVERRDELRDAREKKRLEAKDRL